MKPFFLLIVALACLWFVWSAPIAATSAPQAQPSDDTRARVIQLALAQVGKPYVLGTQGPDTFDCSGLVQWVYRRQGIDTGRTTFDQLAQLPSVMPADIQPGDMIYFQFSWDQHTGILADVNGDGRWDMINAGTPQIGVVVTDNVFADPFWTNAIIGYRRAL
jgi:peptidoglycan DL-endopeptidase CwlO